MKRIILAVASSAVASFLAASIALPCPVHAQEFPTKPIRILVPLPPGGSNDLVARIFSERMPASLGQPVLVENRPGGSGNAATEAVAHAAPDGYTLILSNTSHTVNAA